MKLTKEQLKEAMLRIYGMLCSGDEESDILDEMGLSADEYEKIKAAMFDLKAEEVRSRPVEHVYVQYLIDQTRNLRDLDTFIRENRNTKQATATVGAIRARATILDEIITKGQEFGIIKKVPNRTELIGGVVLAELTNNELKREMTGALGALNFLLEKYGERNIIDVTTGDLHRGKGLPEAVLVHKEDEDGGKKKTSKRRDKVRKGRRVVKRVKEVD
jgi:hypothetical protein